MTMAVFDGFSVALADHVMPGHLASRLLHRLERTNLFLIPLRDGWFRFHPLFASYAASALELEDPDRVAELHRRGGEWFAAHAHTEEAVHHLLAADDSQQAATLIQVNWLGYVGTGRTTTVLGWLHGLRGTPADTEAPATVTAAWIAALTGDRDELRRRLAVLEIMTDDGPLPDGTRSARSASMLIRGLFGFDGPDRMLADARRAAELENTPGTLWHAVACTALGHAALLTGDVALARAQLGAAAPTPTAPAIVRLVALGTLALCEAEQGNHQLGGSWPPKPWRSSPNTIWTRSRTPLSPSPPTEPPWPPPDTSPKRQRCWTTGCGRADTIPGSAPGHPSIISWWPPQLPTVRETPPRPTGSSPTLDHLIPWDDETIGPSTVQDRRHPPCPRPESPDPGRRCAPHTPRAADPASAPRKPDPPGDRPRPAPVAQHDQNLHCLPVPETWGPLSNRSDRDHAHTPGRSIRAPSRPQNVRPGAARGVPGVAGPILGDLRLCRHAEQHHHGDHFRVNLEVLLGDHDRGRQVALGCTSVRFLREVPLLLT